MVAEVSNVQKKIEIKRSKAFISTIKDFFDPKRNTTTQLSLYVHFAFCINTKHKITFKIQRFFPRRGIAIDRKQWQFDVVTFQADNIGGTSISEGRAIEVL